MKGVYDGTYRYETSYGEAWDFESDSEFVSWAEAEGMIIDDEIKYQYLSIKEAK